MSIPKIKIPGWGSAVGAIASIADKLIPGRKEKLNNELEALSREYRKALAENDDMRAAQLDRRMRELRQRVSKL